MFCCYSRLIVFTVIGLFWALDMSAEVLNKKSWLEATKICTLLGSKNKGEVHREKINITIDVPDDLYWIGAIVNQTLWFEVADQGEDTRLFGCIAVNVSSGNASLHEFPCDTNLTPLCEQGTTFKGTPNNEATESSDTSTYLAVGLASGFGVLVILIVVGVILLKRRKKVGMKVVNIPPLYAEVVDYVNCTDKTPQGNPRDSGGYVQSLGHITNDDYDQLQ